jgi:hypothetical protein
METEKYYANRFSKTVNDFETLILDLTGYLSSKLDLTIYPRKDKNDFGFTHLSIPYLNRRVLIRIHATGQVIINCQTQLTAKEQDELDTSIDYLPYDMEPNSENVFYLNEDDGLKKLIPKIKEYFAMTEAS